MTYSDLLRAHAINPFKIRIHLHTVSCTGTNYGNWISTVWMNEIYRGYTGGKPSHNVHAISKRCNMQKQWQWDCRHGHLIYGGETRQFLEWIALSALMRHDSFSYICVHCHNQHFVMASFIHTDRTSIITDMHDSCTPTIIGGQCENLRELDHVGWLDRRMKQIQIFLAHFDPCIPFT